MNTQVIDIATFKKSSDFYSEIPLVLTVKSFDLQAIRKRYLAAQKNEGGTIGSVERREVSEGGLVSLSLSKGQVLNAEIIHRCKEPRGIASKGNRWAFSSENKVYILENDEIKVIENPWFSYIHTVDFHPTENRILISSSGFDLILEYNFETLKPTKEWWAWDHGFNKGYDHQTGQKIVLSRSPITSPSSEFKNLVITDPVRQVLPTAMRAAFINSVVYHPENPDKWIATLFHKGEVIEIDSISGKHKVVIEGMRSPHGGMCDKTGYLATSTAAGEVIRKGILGSESYDFSNLSGKASEVSDREWLQNSKVHHDLILTIDSNRTSFVVFDPRQKLIDLIPYNPDWAVQDMVVMKIKKEQPSLLLH